MAIANLQVGPKVTSGGGTVTGTLPALSTPGSLIVAVIGTNAKGFAFSSPNGGWQQADSSGFADDIVIRYLRGAANPGGQNNFTFTDTSNGDMTIEMSEWSGADPNAPLDVHANGATGAGTSATATVGGAKAGDLGIALWAVAVTGQAMSDASGWTSLLVESAFAGGLASVEARYKLGVSGTVSDQESCSPGSASWDWIVATFVATVVPQDFYAVALETGTDRLQLEEQGAGVLIAEQTVPWFYAFEKEGVDNQTGEILLEDGSGALLIEGLLFYAIGQETQASVIDMETGERILLEDGDGSALLGDFNMDRFLDRLLLEDSSGVLLSEEAETIDQFYGVFQEAGIDRILLENGSGGLISEEPTNTVFDVPLRILRLLRQQLLRLTRREQDTSWITIAAAPVNPDLTGALVRRSLRRAAQVRRPSQVRPLSEPDIARAVPSRRRALRAPRRAGIDPPRSEAGLPPRTSRATVRLARRVFRLPTVPPWFQAAPNAWQVVSSWVVAQRSRFWRVTKRGRTAIPILPQAAPNPWQVVASFSLIRAVRRYAWRRPRMHDEPALMPQQAAVPNPAIVEFARNIRRRMLPVRRGKRFEPAWPAAIVPLVFVDWFRRLRRPVWRRPTASRRVVLGDTLAPVATSRRRPLAALRQRRRLAPVLTQVAAIAPAFVDWVRRRAQRGWPRFRRRIGIFVPSRSTEGRDISLMTGALGSAWVTTKPDARWLVKSKLPAGAWDISAARPRWSIITSEVSAWTEPPPRAEDNR